MKHYALYKFDRPLSPWQQMEKYYEILFSYYCGNLLTACMCIIYTVYLLYLNIPISNN